MRRRPYLILGLLALVAAVVIVAFARRGAPPVEVDVDRVARRQPFRSFVTASGEIVAARYADIGSSVMGRLVDLPVAEGDRVRRRPGRWPASTASRRRPMRARPRRRSRRSRPNAPPARRRGREPAAPSTRARALRAEGLAPQADLDQAIAAADSARARREAAEKRVAQGRAHLRQRGDRSPRPRSRRRWTAS